MSFEKKYQKGAIIKEEEFGILYPDGTVTWGYSANVRGDLDTVEGRAQILKEWEERVAREHIVPTNKITFMKRIKTTKFSDVTYITE